jgi:hypothetical protein
VREPLPPIDTPEQRAALRRSNREALAENLRWPDGRLEECGQASADHPGWYVMWWPGGSCGPEYFSADHGERGPQVTAPTLADLLIAMGKAEERIREAAKQERPYRPIT